MKDLREIERKRVVVVSESQGCEITLLAMGAGDLVAMGEFEGSREAVFQLLASCIIDDAGESYLTVEDVKQLPYELILELTDPVMELNGMVDDEKKS